MYAIGCALVNVMALLFKIVAYQNERSGFVTILAYIGLIYGFFGDTFIFKERFGALELIGVIVILVLNLALVCSKMQQRS